MRQSSVLRAQDREAGEAAAYPQLLLLPVTSRRFLCRPPWGRRSLAARLWDPDLAGYDGWGDGDLSHRAGGQTFPAVVFQLPQWNDPAARDLLSPEGRTCDRSLTWNELAGWLSGLIERERAYFLAEGRRPQPQRALWCAAPAATRFFAALPSSLSQTAIPAGEGVRWWRDSCDGLKRI